LYTLSLVYRDAFNSQLNDRYSGKWHDYADLARAASRRLYQIGLGYLNDPISRAAAPLLSSVPGTPGTAIYYVATAFVNVLGQEGEASETLTFTTPDGSQLVVRPAGAGANAVGWNVYAGVTPDILLQNS